MNSLYFSRPIVSRHRAFTLLELLVVISIIAVLAGILLPVAGNVMEKAKKAEARAVISSILTSVKSYQTDYGVYPVDPGPANAASTVAYDTTFATDAPDPGKEHGGHNAILFDVLRAINSDTSVSPASSTSTTWKTLNSRRVVYFEAKDVKNTAVPRSGFIPSKATNLPKTAPQLTFRDLVDPWGGLYCIRMDSSYSDKIENPYPTSPSTSFSSKNPDTDTANETDDKLLRVPVAAWCPGKDLMYGDKTTGAITSTTDDVVSWQ